MREGPYRVYGPLASGEGPEAERWRRTTPVRVGALVWAIDYWPSPELWDRLRSSGPPWVLVWGLLMAMVVASLIRTDQVSRRAVTPAPGAPLEATPIAAAGMPEPEMALAAGVARLDPDQEHDDEHDESDE